MDGLTYRLREQRTGNQWANPAGSSSGDIGDSRNRRCCRSIPLLNNRGQVSRLSQSGRCRRSNRLCRFQARGLRLSGDRQVDVVDCRRRVRCRALDRGVHLMAELGPVDLGLCFHSEAGMRESLFGPHDFGGRPHLRSLNGDRGIGRQLGTFALCAGLSMTIVSRLASPQPQDRWQQGQKCEERDRKQLQYQDARADRVNCCMATHRAPRP